MKEMLGGCNVCADEQGWKDNPLVYCDGKGCNVAVHKVCYGIKKVPSGNWFCNRCEASVGRVQCMLCPSKDGAMKRTHEGGWAHVACALYIPEVTFGNVKTMEPVMISTVPASRFRSRCALCPAIDGAKMSCQWVGCKRTFHVTCAQREGLLCERTNQRQPETTEYCGYCREHAGERYKRGHKAIPSFWPIPHDESTPNTSPVKPCPAAVSTTAGPASMSAQRMLGAEHAGHSSSDETLSAVENELIDVVQEGHPLAILADASQKVSRVEEQKAPLPPRKRKPNISPRVRRNSKEAKLQQPLPASQPLPNGDGELRPSSSDSKCSEQSTSTPTMNDSSQTRMAWPRVSSLEELLEWQVEQGTSFLTDCAQYFDLSSFLQTLSEVKRQCRVLEDEYSRLEKRRDRLLVVNSRLKHKLETTTSSASKMMMCGSPMAAPMQSSTPNVPSVRLLLSPTSPTMTAAAAQYPPKPAACFPFGPMNGFFQLASAGSGHPMPGGLHPPHPLPMGSTHQEHIGMAGAYFQKEMKE